MPALFLYLVVSGIVPFLGSWSTWLLWFFFLMFGVFLYYLGSFLLALASFRFSYFRLLLWFFLNKKDGVAVYGCVIEA